MELIRNGTVLQVEFHKGSILGPLLF